MYCKSIGIESACNSILLDYCATHQQLVVEQICYHQIRDSPNLEFFHAKTRDFEVF